MVSVSLVTEEEGTSPGKHLGEGGWGSMCTACNSVISDITETSSVSTCKVSDQLSSPLQGQGMESYQSRHP